MDPIAAPELVGRLADPAWEPPAPLVLVEDVERLDADEVESLAVRLRARPAVFAATRGPAGPLDLVLAEVDEAGGTAVEQAVAAHPQAAVALAVLLRGSEERSVAEGLVMESATYSTLQAGVDHRRWLADGSRPTPPAAPAAGGPGPVGTFRQGDRLELVLRRPAVRNAFSAAMREALLDGLAVAAADPSVSVLLRGDGPDFCAGGDLTEFGTAADPATAHVVRLERSVGRALAQVADRTTAEVHGACVGAGVELPAFAGHVVATPDARFRLPELAMGLVPGAGGTVSLPRRIGRHRTAWLGLTGAWIDAERALAWGLVDEVR